MADWRMRLIRCPECKAETREPVNVHQLPRVHFQSLNGPEHTVYVQQCHRCSTRGASPALQHVYDQAWQRILAVAEQKMKGGVL